MCPRATGEGDVTRERQGTKKRKKKKEFLRTTLTNQMWKMLMNPAVASSNLSVSTLGSVPFCLTPYPWDRYFLESWG
jgi:hypothetical protein